ncbi:hypothetical protein [Cohaesibacter sp. ES.047]|nr:hypothetical protein [Cohaesibacter sp. ES.047]
MTGTEAVVGIGAGGVTDAVCVLSIRFDLGAAFGSASNREFVFG